MLNLLVVCVWFFSDFWASTEAVPLFLPQHLRFNSKLAVNQSTRHKWRNDLKARFLEDEPVTTLERQFENGRQQYCPEFCNCPKGAALTIENCQRDPGSQLDALLRRNLNVSGLVIINSFLSRVPRLVCEMTELRSIDFTNNTIRNLPWKCLKNLKYIQSIVLSKNMIAKLENGSFYGFPNLNSIRIDHNNISEIDVDVFIQLGRMQFDLIDLSDNYINSLDPWPLMFIHQRTEINLDNNHISKFTNRPQWHVNCTPGLIPIADLILSQNKIRHISDILNGWNITGEIPIMCLLGHEKSLSIDLSANPYVCDCIDYEVYKFLDQVKKGEVMGMFCDKPQDMYGQRIVSVPLDDFICHVQKDCPGECVCIDQPNEMNMSISCIGPGLDSIPEQLPVLPKHNYHYKLVFTSSNIIYLDHRAYFSRTRQAIFSHNNISNISVAALNALSSASAIYLDHNQIQYLPKNISSVHLSDDIDVRLESNAWVCDCNAIETRSWMVKNSKVITDRAGILCNTPSRLKGFNLLSISEDDMICGDPPNKELIGYLGAGGSALFICFIFIGVFFILRYKRVWLYRQFHWHPFDWDECDEENKEFDVFVSYSNDDEEYAGEFLIPSLERKGYKVAYHRVHFHGGKPITVSIEECIRKSKRTLAVFSRSFLQSEWCMWEFTVALEMDGNEGRHRLIAIKYEDVDIASLNLTLKAYFKRYTYIERDSHVFWDNLEYSLPVNRIGTPEERAFAADRNVHNPQMEDGLNGGEDDLEHPLLPAQ